MSTLNWRDVVITESVTVARHDGLTLITDRYVMWDADAMAPVITRLLPRADGPYTLQRVKFTPDPNGKLGSTAEDLADVFRDLKAKVEAADVTALMSKWSYNDVRICVTVDGDAFGLPEDMASLFDIGALGLWLRSTGDPSKPVGLYRPDGESWRIAGLIQPLRVRDYADEPVVDTVTTETLKHYRDDLEWTKRLVNLAA